MSKVTVFIETELAKVDTTIRVLNERRDILINELNGIDEKIAIANLENDELLSDKEAVENKDEKSDPIL